MEAKLLELGLRPRDGKGYHSLSDEEIAELESTINVKLPVDYHDFVTEYGDSSFARIVEVVPVSKPPKHISESGRTGFATFYGSDFESRGLLTVAKIYKGRMPVTIIPIGRDLAGNQYCLGLSGKDRDKIYLWDFEGEPAEEDYIGREEEVPKNIWYQNLTLMAESFTDFINRLIILSSNSVS